ncbi:ribosome biogenesis GTPase [Rubricella aquisinus]|uniref:Small ribosomal subunit biogenesis GTPase RsgA n=1 Tax=Rubricella aquisinus TaxID=2028108 RepID=A0A840X3R3_9RHOB|nr:ribosome small subunit-dependent GTPase A [Rubricella aquisinus]MBB5516475.1 ribosome biogenesis GTPase [Rubricella aquisinus]
MTLAALGFGPDFAEQAEGASVARISDVHRDEVRGLTGSDQVSLLLPNGLKLRQITVGDWVTFDPESGLIARVLDRRTVLKRGAAGNAARAQLIAANVDTLFIVTSCNHDFNLARLERYLALAQSVGTTPLILLTKADDPAEPRNYLGEAQGLSPLADALALNAHDADDLARLAPWVQPGMTAALVGSSGVGKSTILNGLTGAGAITQGIREDDSRGRHTTTARALRQTTHGGWLIDTPGMRSLALRDTGDGIEQVFADLVALEPDCHFSDCTHQHEPGCAILAAVDAGQADAARVARWLKLRAEDQLNTATGFSARQKQKAAGQRPARKKKKKR